MNLNWLGSKPQKKSLDKFYENQLRGKRGRGIRVDTKNYYCNTNAVFMIFSTLKPS